MPTRSLLLLMRSFTMSDSELVTVKHKVSVANAPTPLMSSSIRVNERNSAKQKESWFNKFLHTLIVYLLNYLPNYITVPKKTPIMITTVCIDTTIYITIYLYFFKKRKGRNCLENVFNHDINQHKGWLKNDLNEKDVK